MAHGLGSNSLPPPECNRHQHHQDWNICLSPRVFVRTSCCFIYLYQHGSGSEVGKCIVQVLLFFNFTTVWRSGTNNNPILYRIYLAIRCLAKSDLTKILLRQMVVDFMVSYIYISDGYQSVSKKSPTKKQIQLQQLFENTSKTWISPDVGWNDTMKTPPVLSMCSSRV